MGVNVSKDEYDQLTGTAAVQDLPGSNGSLLKKFPTELCDAVRKRFPKATNNTDAIVAALALYVPDIMDEAGVKESLSGKQMDLIHRYKEGYAVSLHTKLKQIEEQLSKLGRKTDDSEIRLDYLMYTQMKRDGAPTGVSDLSQVTVNDFSDSDQFINFRQTVKHRVWPLLWEILTDRTYRRMK